MILPTLKKRDKVWVKLFGVMGRIELIKDGQFHILFDWEVKHKWNWWVERKDICLMGRRVR